MAVMMCPVHLAVVPDQMPAFDARSHGSDASSGDHALPQMQQAVGKDHAEAIELQASTTARQNHSSLHLHCSNTMCICQIHVASRYG